MSILNIWSSLKLTDLLSFYFSQQQQQQKPTKNISLDPSNQNQPTKKKKLFSQRNENQIILHYWKYFVLPISILEGLLFFPPQFIIKLQNRLQANFKTQLPFRLSNCLQGMLGKKILFFYLFASASKAMLNSTSLIFR